MAKQILSDHMDILRRGRNVAHHMASVANDVPWAVTYASSLCNILNEIEKKINYRPSIVSLASQARQYLMKEEGTPFFFSMVGKAVSHGLVDDENSTRYAVSMMDMQPWRKYGKKPCPQVKADIFELKKNDVLSSMKRKGNGKGKYE